MRGDVYEMIFALLYALGLRVGEVTRLRRSDIDFEHKLLVIRQSKFGKSRLVPFGPRVEEKLLRFLDTCECRLGLHKPEHAVFSFSKDRCCPVSTTTVSWIFHKLVLDLEIKAPPGVASPHLHCLRHSFAVATLLRWYREDIDPTERLLYLSAFLGHVNPTSTAVYLTITDELLQAASKRYKQFAAPALERARS
jgi:integrase